MALTTPMQTQTCLNANPDATGDFLLYNITPSLKKRGGVGEDAQQSSKNPQLPQQQQRARGNEINTLGGRMRY
jgi:hypothetical protein